MMWFVAYGSGFLGVILGVTVMALMQIASETDARDEITDTIVYPERRRS